MSFRRVMSDMQALFQVRAAIAEIIEAGKEALVRVEPYAKPKSRQQMATLHKWFGEIANQTGDSPDAIKDVMKQRFLPLVPTRMDTMVRQSTTALTKREMMDFMTQVQAMAADYGLQLTQPEPQCWERWNDELNNQENTK
jgi:molybdopterin-biosynthesis enzyme MoeA-like protein